MKERTKYIIYLILSISISLALLGCVYNVMTGKGVEDQLLPKLLLNLPLCILIGMMDLGIIVAARKYLCIRNEVTGALLDLFITSILCMLLAGGLNYVLDDNVLTPDMILKYTLPVLPWNWIIVMQIEIFLSKSRRDRIEKEKARYQFMALKNQVNPHFLFNSLSVLASLAYEDAAKTSAFAKKLSSVYRYLLTTSEKPTVTLGEEMKFVETYLYLEKIRFGNTLQTEIDIPSDAMNRKVIPTSLQMLVENAIKHNINSEESPLRIEISADSEAVTVSNSFQPRAVSAGSRTGLRNLRQQYAIYGKSVYVGQNPAEFTVRLPFIGE